MDVDIEEIKKCLQDAELYEENMSKQDMLQFYKVIKDSENSATIENKTRQLSQESEDLFDLADDAKDESPEIIESTPPKEKKGFAPKRWSSEKKHLPNSECNNNMDTDESSNDEKVCSNIFNTTINFCDMEDDSTEQLKIIFHKRKCKIPNFKNEKFSVEARTKLLLHYHTNISKKIDLRAKKSLNYAPIPKFIKLASINLLDEDDKDNRETTYTSRSGRQTKRKSYNEDMEDSCDSFTNKKSKTKNKDEEIEWLSKKTSTEKNPTKKKETRSIEIQSSEESIEMKTPHKPEKRPAIGSKKLNNTEIIKRSSLFSDSPRRLSTRQERLFDNLVKADAKNKQQEKEIESFEKTLEILDEEYSDINNENLEPSQNEKKEEKTNVVELEEAEETEFIPRRIVPPIPGRKPIHGVRRGRKASSVPKNQPNITIDSPTRAAKQRAEKLLEEVNSPSTSRTNNKRQNSVEQSDRELSQGSLVATIDCPICNNKFSEAEVEEHAATCGENLDEGEPSPSISSTRSKRSKIMCEICDATLTLSTDYEVHVAACLKNITSKKS